MQASTTFTIEGHQIVEYKGVVRGITVRSPTISQGIFGGLKRIVGGQIGAYTQMCEQAREHAFRLMIEHAVEVGRQRRDRRPLRRLRGRPGATEVLCYGTAVVVQ